MNKSLKIYLLVFAVLVAVMIAIDQTREKPPDWSPTYHLTGKNPLDLYVLNREIDHLCSDNVVRYNKNPFTYFQQQDSFDIKKETYLFVKDYLNLDEAMVNKLLNAVKGGSTLFVVSNGFPDYLTDTLQTTCGHAQYNVAPLTFNSQSDNTIGVKLRFSKKVWSDEAYFYTPVFGQNVFVSADTASATALGYMTLPNKKEFINFMEFKFGKGKVFLHNQPVIFSNYSLLSKEPLQEYAERTLSYLPDQPVVWFVESQLNVGDRGKTQLSVVFNYPALRMAWLIFLYGLLLFIFFTAKRRQRVIPVVKPLRNTIVEFAQTIGNLYFQEGDITDIARKKIIYFLDRVRRTYNIDTQLPDEELIRRLHLKSGKDTELIREIVILISEINRQNRCDHQELIRLSTLMDRFR